MGGLGQQKGAVHFRAKCATLIPESIYNTLYLRMMEMASSHMLQKSGVATLEVAQILAGLEPGERIPTVTELSAQCNMARGNIQIALNNLKQSGCIYLEAHGQSGTIATEINYLALANYCGNTNLTCVMPLPYSLRYEGLATGLYSELNQHGMNGIIAFMRGSGYRVQCVEEKRFHLCVMSRLAYQHYIKEGRDLQLVAAFGPESYVSSHRVFVRPDFDGRWAGCRIGIDQNSVDQEMLTRACFKDKDVELFPVIYSQLVPFLRSGIIDAGVWNADTLPEGLKAWSVPELEQQGADTEAVLVCRKTDNVTAQLVRRSISIQSVETLQRQVLEKSMIPRY